MDWGNWAGLATVSFVAALLQATNGFGFAVLAVPFFLLLAPPGKAVPTIIVISLAVSLFVVPRLYRFVDRALLRRLAWGAVPALVAILAVYPHADAAIVQAIAGAIVTGFAILLTWHRYYRRGRTIDLRPRRDLAIGVVAGIATGLVGMAGPPPLIYLMLGGAPMVRLRATLIGFFAVIYAVTLAANVILVGVDRVTWLTALSLLPFVWVGGRIGLRLGERLGEATAAALALSVLGATGLYTLAAALHTALW